MGPIFEHRFVDRLRLLQIGADVVRNAAVEDVVMASLDDVDRIDLHIAKMFDRALGPPRAFSERSRRIELLGVILDRTRLR